MVKDIVLLLVDPRGRMSRQDLLAAATFMLLIDVAIASLASGAALYVIKAVAYWIGGVGIVKRLHDIGRSGWWLPAGAGALCVWAAVLGLLMGFVFGMEGLQPGAPAYIALLAALMLPAMGITLWLHLAKGQTGANRYGSEPAGLSSTILRRRVEDAAIRP